jgi:O-antigen ligase
MWDQANQYVAVGETGGLLPFLCFVAILVIGFRYVGRARRAARGDRKRELFVWTLGAALFANVVAFFGISYFDQTMVVWYLMLASLGAMVASMSAARRTVAIPSAKEDWSAADLPEAEMAVPQMRVSDLS